MVGVAVPQALEMASDTELKKTISESGLTKYGQECKKLQVESVLSLLRGKNTFILAATGFGKSRIPELYLNLLTKDRLGNIAGVIIVLNPLDALGDNQVEEKIRAGFSAINATAENFDATVANDILNGVYNFVYVSPEIFLDNKRFNNLYLSPAFQQKLALVVVDEAHMIYSWGLVEDGEHLQKLRGDTNRASAKSRHPD
ncbi:ATP-dependent DNA helicase sgs1 [Puccinia graminis f. sp. tritici]|uniref:DNA 3'-5' helicase n=1 Tax=Puccinia graminis f. sp. tritici TaxID=56615 RepID=A0A5B0RB17_PUCGR|nr:ATP-dependent DNA helicase sgs1 [Puccinia graminis f. sp. tritici]